MNEDVYLYIADSKGNVLETKQFKAVSVVDVSFESTVTENVIESGEVISDHVLHTLPTIEVDMILFDDHRPGKMGFASRFDSYEWLLQMWWQKRFVTLACDLGEFSEMVIASISPSEENSSGNTFRVRVTFKQIMRVEFVPVSFQYTTDEDGTVYEAAPITKEGEQVTLYQPNKKKKEEGGWNYPVLNWVADNTWRGWI
jgi:hypothetical protein